MKLLVDHLIFAFQKFGGVSRYHCEILKRMQREDYNISVKLADNYYLKELGTVPFVPFFPNNEFKGKRRFLVEFGKIYSIKEIKKGSFDVLHLTHYDSYALNKTKKPIVMTYHDKQFSTFNYNEKILRQQKECFKRVDAVIAISENTKKDIIELFDYPEEKINVIHHGIELQVKKYPSVIEGRYMLFVGNRLKYKNFKKFLRAFSCLRDKEISLFCVGGGAFKQEELQLIKDYKLEGRVQQRSVTDSQLNSLYQNAVLFCFPSLYEGFGMPLLEAMANSCPVVCSNASCFPEIAGDAAVYFNPEDVDEMTDVLQSVVDSESMRQDLVHKGLINVKQFTWEDSVRKHMELYKSLM